MLFDEIIFILAIRVTGITSHPGNLLPKEGGHGVTYASPPQKDPASPQVSKQLITD